MRFIVPAVIAAFLASSLGAQTRVALPHAIGNLDLPVGWIALGPTELQASERDSDPEAEPARQLVRGMASTLRQDRRTEDNVLIHSPGTSPGQVRTISAYSADVTASSEELQTDKSIDQIRSALEEGLAASGGEIVFLGSDKPDVFAIDSISLTFRRTIGDLEVHNRIHVVPAGERLAYFETQFMPDDMDAPLAISSVLHTFDGAAETPESDILEKMILGGVAGAIAGISVALLRRRRLMKPRIGVDTESEG